MLLFGLCKKQMDSGKKHHWVSWAEPGGDFNSNNGDVFALCEHSSASPGVRVQLLIWPKAFVSISVHESNPKLFAFN